MRLHWPQLNLRLLMLLVALVSTLVATFSYWLQVWDLEQRHRVANIETGIYYTKTQQGFVHRNYPTSFQLELARLEAQEAIYELARMGIENTGRGGNELTLELHFTRSMSQAEMQAFYRLLQTVRRCPEALVKKVDLAGLVTISRQLEDACPEAEVIP